MQVTRVCLTLLLLLISSRDTIQQFAGCRESYYLHDGSCTQCPERCATCISDTNCTNCNSNYYGPVCQYTCQQDCVDLCHKEHGYCTDGCDDGFFPEPNSPLCAKCPAQCKICKSWTECVECLPGYYDDKCETRCPNRCKMCYKTSGACLVCDKGYFNQDGQCRRCPDGCDSCSGEGTINTYTCSQSCLQVNESFCQCKPNCTLMEENLSSLSVCMVDGESLLVTQQLTDSMCSNETPIATSESLTGQTLLLITISVVLMLLCASVALNILWIKRNGICRKSEMEVGDAEENNDLNPTEREHEERQGPQA